MSTEETCMKSLSQFVKVLQLILTIYADKAKQPASNKKGLLKYIRDFEKQVVKKKSIEFKICHAPLFKDLYHEHRQAFLDMDEENADFISKKKLKIWFGQDDGKIRKKNLRLPIGVCYDYAKEMHNEAEEKITGEDDDEDAKIIESAEYTMYYELLYYLLDNIYNALECLEETRDLKSLRSSLKNLRELANVDEHNEIPGNSLTSVMRTINKAITGTDANFDEEQASKALGKATEMFSNPELMEGIPEIIKDVSDLKPKEGQSFTDMMHGMLDRVAPVLERTMPMSNEPVPDGVTFSDLSGKVKEAFGAMKEEKIEVIPKRTPETRSKGGEEKIEVISKKNHVESDESEETD